MNKKMYQQPTQQIVNVEQTEMLCSSLNNVGGNAGIKYGGAAPANSAARSRDGGGWDDFE